MNRNCGFESGGRSCARRAVATMHLALDHHNLGQPGYRLCADHLRYVIETQAHNPSERDGLLTVIEWRTP